MSLNNQGFMGRKKENDALKDWKRCMEKARKKVFLKKLKKFQKNPCKRYCVVII